MPHSPSPTKPPALLHVRNGERPAGKSGHTVTMGIEKRLGWLDMPWERRSKQDWGPLWTGYGSLNNSHFRWGTK